MQSIAPTSLVRGQRSDAIRAIHFPVSREARDVARERLVFYGIFAMRLLIASRRFESSARPGRAHCGSGALLDKFLKALPFELTAAQRKVIAEIRRDLAANYPMNRLLQGDVGSGKTVVAIAAMLLAVEAEYQAALMALTQILAEQHYDVLRRWLDPLDVCVALRTAARQEESASIAVIFRLTTLKSLSGRMRCFTKVFRSRISGCRSLMSTQVRGAQRARLTAREPSPDVLVMTATPIPRTLTMTVYGDLDVSTIDEMPGNRGKILTAVRDTSKLGEVLSFLRTQLEKGRQLYVIYPLIDESEKLDVKAAAAEYELWRERLHPFRCELLHGRIPAPEKHNVMDRFRGGDTNAYPSARLCSRSEWMYRMQP